MNNLTLNIGLNVGNTEPINQLFNTREVLKEYFPYEPDNSRIEEGEWEGIRERVLIAKIKLKYKNISLINALIEDMCERLNQDGIAYSLDGEGNIIYNSLYEGERYEFNPDYFREF